MQQGQKAGQFRNSVSSEKKQMNHLFGEVANIDENIDSIHSTVHICWAYRLHQECYNGENVTKGKKQACKILEHH